MGALNCKATAQNDVVQRAPASNATRRNDRVVEPINSEPMNAPFVPAPAETTTTRSVASVETQVTASSAPSVPSQPSPKKRNVTKNIPAAVQELIDNTVQVFQIQGVHVDEVYNLFVDAIESVEVDASHVLAHKGRSLDRLFFIESGAVEFVVQPDVIYSVGAGCTLGSWTELSQAATVRTTARSVVWSMSLDKFVRILLTYASSASIMRLRWLSNCPELAAMSVFDLVRLMKISRSVAHEAGDLLYKEGEAATECVLIESGRCSLYSNKKPGDGTSNRSNVTPSVESPPIPVFDEVDRDFLIVRAKLEAGSHAGTPATSSKRGSGTNAGTPGGSTGNPSSRKRGSGVGGTSGLSAAVSKLMNLRATPKQFMRGSRERVIRPNDDPTFMNGQQPLCDLREGAFVGQGMIRISDSSSPWRATGSADCVSPITLVVTEKVESFCFSLRDFESLFGALRVTNYESAGGSSLPLHYRLHFPAPVSATKAVPIKFTEDNFQLTSVAGHGAFGVVVVSYFCATDAVPAVSESDSQQFALKIVSKADICELERARYIMDEAAICSSLRGPFINTMYGTYQTANELVLVSEVISGGDLWSVIYEFGSSGTPTDVAPEETDALIAKVTTSGLPLPLIRFYAASLVTALAHIHDRDIVYRDLKPENVMLTERGDVRLIDFGFAKKVPFQKTERGKVKTYPRTFTVCGTPEYMAPEMLFTLGCNQSADVWSVGVLLYEMLMRKTPFAPKKPEDQVEILTNIALAKVRIFFQAYVMLTYNIFLFMVTCHSLPCLQKNGVTYAKDFATRSGDSGLHELLRLLLNAEPKE